ncbi:MAG: arginase family protein [Cloacibacterium normanense]
MKNLFCKFIEKVLKEPNQKTVNSKNEHRRHYHFAKKNRNSTLTQLGSVITNEIPENGILLVFCSDYRGGNGNAVAKNFDTVREEFYKLSKFDFEIPICDLGDLISGKSLEDTHYILQEILSSCLYKNTVPIVVGGGNDLSIAMIHALNFHQKNIRYTQINNKIDLSNEGDEISEQNFLQKIFNSKLLSLKDYHHLGYQKHLNEIDAVKLAKGQSLMSSDWPK